MNERWRPVELTDAELAELYARYAPVLQRRCFDILKNEELAHDAVQETFAKVIRNASTFRQQSSPLTWMYKISTNYCLNQIRNGKTRRGKLEHNREDIVGPGFSTPNTQNLDEHRVLALLEASDEQTRSVVVHTYFDDCTRQEVADLVGISVPTVRKRLNTFLERARRQLGHAIAALTVLSPSLWSSPWTS